MPKFLLIWGVSSGSKSISSQKSHENIGNPHYIQRQHFFFCSLVSMKHCMASLPCLNPTTWSIIVSHNFLTNVSKHKGITTTLAKCVTRCKHHCCSLCTFVDLHCYPHSMSQPIQHGQLWCLTTFDQCHQT